MRCGLCALHTLQTLVRVRDTAVSSYDDAGDTGAVFCICAAVLADVVRGPEGCSAFPGLPLGGDAMVRRAF